MFSIWLHRGRTTPDRPGNTLDDFTRAEDAHAYGIETDIVLSQDNEIIVYHPGDRDPDAHTYSWKRIHSLYPEIVHLDTLFEFLHDNPALHCCLEVKEDTKYSKKRCFDLIDLVTEKIFSARLTERVYLTAPQSRIAYFELFADCSVLHYAKNYAPPIRTHVITCFPYNLVSLAGHVEAHAVSIGILPGYRLSTAAFWCFERLWNLKIQIEECRRKGISVWGGIANTKHEIEHFAFDLGIDGIFTEDIALAQNILGKEITQ